VQYESLCPQCYFRERDKFFAEKAAEAEQAAERAGIEKDPVPVCTECGAVLAEGQKFCGECGKPVEK
jgi:membrane protease subunit (stomatin/prohibitin family)